MRDESGNVRLVSGERLGDELSKLLLGPRPAEALRLARDTRVLTELVPALAEAVGFEQDSKRQHLTLDEHTFEVVQAAADAGAPLAVRLAALLHDAGKPGANGDHAERGARLADDALERLRYATRLRTYVVRLVREHAFPLDHVDERFARRFLRTHGDQLAFDLVAHKQADLNGKQVPQAEHDAAMRLQQLLEQQRAQPHRLEDLAVDGADLLALGYHQGPELGRTLDALLDAVVDDPALNTRDELLGRAKALAG
jgi:tRNA nucleotidyltransferase/poly(A) polymerase